MSSTNPPLNPIVMKSRLAGTPKSKPRYATTVQLNSGESLNLADPKATRAMVALMDMNAVHGGAASHYGGPAAFAELMSATHGLMFHLATKKKMEWHEAFHFVNDAGHCENGIYALKANYGFADLTPASLKKFRSIDSFLTGHGEAHLFPQGVLVSNGPLGSGLPQAQGLAIADALSGRKRITICALSDGGAMEGEAKEALAAIPGFARKAKMAPFILLISDNRTKLSGRIESDAFSMEPTFQSLEKLGWKVMRLENGHSVQACVSTLEEAIEQVSLDASTPIVIHARTIKGKGSQKAEISSSGGHGFPLKSASELPAFLSEIYEGEPLPSEFKTWIDELQAWETAKAAEKTVQAGTALQGGAAQPPQAAVVPKEKVQLGVASALISARKRGLPVITVSADLQGSTGVADFQKSFPESSIDVGVAEANMVSVAIGLSLEGYIPIVDTFAQFGVTKGSLPLTMASLSQAPLIAIFSHTGFQDAADGASHQAISFYAQVSSIPHVEVYSLSTSSEAESLITQAIDDFAKARAAGRVPPTRVFFLGRENFPRRLVPEGVNYELGRAQIIHDSCRDSGQGTEKNILIVAGGSLVSEALNAAKELKTNGIGSIVIHASAINHPDLALISQALHRTCQRVVTVEEHRLTGGMGAMLTHALALSGEPMKVKSLAVGDRFGQSAYSAHELYKLHGIDSSAIVRAASELCGK